MFDEISTVTIVMFIGCVLAFIAGSVLSRSNKKLEDKLKSSGSVAK